MALQHEINRTRVVTRQIIAEKLTSSRLFPDFDDAVVGAGDQHPLRRLD
jgi:hypothetical protein